MAQSLPAAPAPERDAFMISDVLVVTGIALLTAQRSDYSVAGAVLMALGALPRALRAPRPTRPLPLPAPLLGILALAALTTLWSEMPGATLGAVIRLWIVAACAVVAAVAFGASALARRVMLGSALMIGASVAMGVAGIGAARDAEGLLQGVTSHPNVLAFGCALCVLSALTWCRPHRDVLAPLACTMVAVTGLVMAESMTAVLALLVALVAAAAVPLLRPAAPLQRHALIVSGVTLGVVAVLAVWGLYDRITEALGRDPTLTGRTEIWQAVIGQIRRHPWSGAGLGATWGDDAPAAATVARQIGFRVFHSHNGYLDVTLQLGLVGLVLLVWLLALSVVRAVRLALDGRTDAWLPAVLVLLTVYSLSETVVLQFAGWMLLCACAVMAACPPRTRPVPSAAPPTAVSPTAVPRSSATAAPGR